MTGDLPWPMRAPGPDGRAVRWRRAWPDGRRDAPTSQREVVLEGVDEAGSMVAARLLVGDHPYRPGSGSRPVLVAPDPALPTLGELTAAGARLTAHRAGKRAVLRAKGQSEDRPWLKAASPKATGRAAARLAAVQAVLEGRAGPPGLVRARPAGEGVQELDHVGGIDLATLLAEGDLARCRAAGRRIGLAMAAFAVPQDVGGPGGPSLAGLPMHDGAAEAAVLRRWVDDAVAYAVLPAAMTARLRAAADGVAAALEALPGSAPVLAHRDLHEAQVVVHPGSDAVTFLDVDTAAWADPALDPANLLAHLDLAALRGHRPAAAAVATGLWSGWHEAGHPVCRGAQRPLRVLRAGAKLRLLAVHAFRSEPDPLLLREPMAATG